MCVYIYIYINCRRTLLFEIWSPTFFWVVRLMCLVDIVSEPWTFLKIASELFVLFFEPEKFESITKSFFLRIRWCFFYYWSTVDLQSVFISGVQQCVIQLYLLIYLHIFKLFPQILKKFFFKFFFRVYWSEKGTYVIFSETSDMFYILNIKHPENKYR